MRDDPRPATRKVSIGMCKGDCDEYRHFSFQSRWSAGVERGFIKWRYKYRCLTCGWETIKHRPMRPRMYNLDRIRSEDREALKNGV